MRIVKTAGQYAVCLAPIGAACMGEVYHMRPFGYGVALALSAFFNPIPLYVGLIGFETLIEPSRYTVTEAAVFAAVMMAACLLRKKRGFSPYFLLLAAVPAGLGRIYTEILGVCFTVLTGVVGTAALRPLIVYRLKYRLLDPELAALGLLAAIYGLSLSAYTPYGFNGGIAVMMTISCVCAYVSGA